MNIDVRILTTFPHHPKTKKLKRKLGADGVLSLIYLWIFVSQSRPGGDLSGMDEEDVAIVSEWDGEPEEFIEVLVALGFLDREDDQLSVHDWAENNPWAAGAEARSKRASKAAKAKWARYQKDDEGCSEQCAKDASSMQGAESSNAPSPSPSPSPKPLPEPKPKPKIVTSIPHDFGISERVKVWAKVKGHSQLEDHLENFILTSQAKGYKYKDWDSAFMTAVRKNWADIKPIPKMADSDEAPY